MRLQKKKIVKKRHEKTLSQPGLTFQTHDLSLHVRITS
jgi:hypothetical protein